ncbi:unnamed protein product, partial [Ectocarpus sp. 13 AM-2016]
APHASRGRKGPLACEYCLGGEANLPLTVLLFRSLCRFSPPSPSPSPYISLCSRTVLFFSFFTAGCCRRHPGHKPCPEVRRPGLPHHQGVPRRAEEEGPGLQRAQGGCGDRRLRDRDAGTVRVGPEDAAADGEGRDRRKVRRDQDLRHRRPPAHPRLGQGWKGRVHRDCKGGGQEVKEPVPQSYVDRGRGPTRAGGGDGAHLRIPSRHRHQRREKG